MEEELLEVGADRDRPRRRLRSPLSVRRISRSKWLLVLVVALASVGDVSVGLEFSSSHQPLPANSVGYVLVESQPAEPTVHGELITYVQPIEPIAGGGSAVRKITAITAAPGLVGVSVDNVALVKRGASFVSSAATSQSERNLALTFKVTPQSCAALPRIVTLSVVSIEPDHRKHSRPIDFDRFPAGFTDPLLDPAVFPHLCNPATGSLAALPVSDVGPQAGAWTVGSKLVTSAGARIESDRGAANFGAYAMKNGYILVGEQRGPGPIDAYSATGAHLWRRADVSVAAVNAAGTVVALADDNGLIELADTATGKTLSSLHAVGYVDGLQFSGSSLLVSEESGDNTLVYRIDPPSSRLHAPEAALPDSFKGTVGLQGFEHCGILQKYSTLATRVGYAGEPLSLGTEIPGQVGAPLHNVTADPDLCPSVVIVGVGSHAVGVGSVYSDFMTLREYSRDHAPHVVLRAGYFGGVVAETATTWLTIAQLEPLPKTYLGPDGDPVLTPVNLMVRCHVGGGCEQLTTPLDEFSTLAFTS